MSDLPERREAVNSMGRRVDQLDAKIDRVGDSVQHVGKELRSALEMLITQQDDRWKWFEQRSEMDSRNQKQAIELLTSSVVRVQQEVASAETMVQLIETDGKVQAAKLVEQQRNATLIHEEQARRTEQIADNLKWVART